MSSEINFDLQPKQLEAFNSRATEILYGGAAGSGKALKKSTKTMTYDGFKEIGDVHVGDVVFDENMKPCNVVAETEIMYGRPCYDIVFDNGEVVTADAQHDWVVYSELAIAHIKINTKDIYDRLQEGSGQRFFLATPNKEKVFIKTVTPVESVPVKCIQVDSPSNQYLITESLIPTHNSHLMRVASIVWSLEIPGLQTYLFRREYNDLVANHLYGSGGYLHMLGELSDKGVCKIIGEKKIKFSNGSTIHLSHCQHESDVYSKYLGVEIHLLLIDELTMFTPTIYTFLRNRCRIGGLALPEEYEGQFPKILCGTNPTGPMHAEVKRMFVDPKPPMEIWKTPPEEGGMLRQYIPARLTDNYVLMDNDPSYADRIRGLGDENKTRAYLEGDWSVAEGAYFGPNWDESKIVIPEFSLENTSYYFSRTYDWGLASPSAVCWFAESDGTSVNMYDPENPDEMKEFWCPKGSIIMIREHYTCTDKPNEGNGELSRQTAQRIKEIEADMPFLVNPGPADTAIFKTEYNDGSIAADMEHEGVTWLRADKRAGSRVNGWAKLAGMMYNAKERDPERPWFLIMDNCRHTIRTLPVLQRDKTNPEDIDTKSEDHLADAIRYRVGFDKPITKVTKFTGF